MDPASGGGKTNKSPTDLGPGPVPSTCGLCDLQSLSLPYLHSEDRELKPPREVMPEAQHSDPELPVTVASRVWSQRQAAWVVPAPV